MKVVLVCLALVGLVVAELPSYFKTCSRDDPDFDKCFVKTGNEVVKTFVKGDEKLQTPAITPLLKHPGAVYEPNDEFFFQLKETDVIGLDTIQILEAKTNFKEKTIWFKFKFNVVEWKGTYVAKALKEKDEAAGKAHIVFTDNTCELNLKFELKDKHLSIVSLTIDYIDKTNIVYNLENLDKHEKVKALWEKSTDGFKKVSSNALAEFFKLVLGQVFKAATYDEILPPKA